MVTPANHNLPVPIEVSAVALVALTSLTSARVFDGAWRGLACPVTAILIAISAVIARKLRPAVRVSLYVAVALGSTAVAIAGLPRRQGSLVGDLVGSFTRGGGDMLSSRWPVVVLPTAVGTLILLTALAAAVAAEAGRRKAPGPAMVAPSIVLLGMLAILAAPAGPPPAWFLALYAVAAVVVLRFAAVVRRRTFEPQLSKGENARRNGAGVALAAGSLALLPIVAAGALIDGRRYDPRNDRSDAPILDEDVSPLSLVADWKAFSPERTMFEAAGQPTDRWRLVALPRYDGRMWSPARDLRLVGARLDQGERPSRSQALTSTVTIRALQSRWVPAPIGIPSRIDVLVRTDGAQSGLLAEQPLTPGEAYTTSVWSQDFSAARVDQAEADRDQRITLEGFEMPSGIRALAERITTGATNDRERAERIAGFLRDRYRLDETSPPGHSLAILQVFLLQTSTGRAEQFVAAYGLLANAAGLPTRIVVGFDGRANASVVASSQALAWPEVAFTGVGWVPFDALPSSQSRNTEVQPETAPVANNERTSPPTTSPQAEGLEANQPEGADGGTDPITARNFAVYGIPAIAVLAIVGYFAGVVWWKRRRRRVADGAPANELVVSRFLTCTDVLVDLGSPLAPGSTNRELVSVASGHLEGAASLTQLAEQATVARYAGQTMGDADVAAADEEVAAFEDLMREVGGFRWWRAKFSTRSIRRGLRP